MQQIFESYPVYIGLMLYSTGLLLFYVKLVIGVFSKGLIYKILDIYCTIAFVYVLLLVLFYIGYGLYLVYKKMKNRHNYESVPDEDFFGDEYGIELGQVDPNRFTLYDDIDDDETIEIDGRPSNINELESSVFY